MNQTAGPENKPHYAALLQLLRTADTIWNSSRSLFNQWHLSPSQFNILNLLHQHPEGLSQSELSRELIMNRSNATGLIDRLEERGLAQRLEAAGDRRAYRVVLTAAGERLLRKILPRYYADAEKVCAHLSKRRTTEFIADLNRAAENARQVAEALHTKTN